MKIATGTEATPATTSAQDVRRSDAALMNENFGAVLDAQLLTAAFAPTTAASAQQELKAGKAPRQGALKDDPTRRAEEKLASRPQESALGLQSAVQNEMNSPAKAAPQSECEQKTESVDHGQHDVAVRSEVKQRGAESSRQRGTDATGGQFKPEKGADQLKGQTQESAQVSTRSVSNSASEGTAKSGESAQAGTTASTGAVGSVPVKTEGSVNSKPGGISSVEALGSLGRKSAFKLQAMERPLTKADADKFVAQASKALAAAIKREGGTMLVRLNPENLGLLKVKIETKEGSLNAKVEASERSARELLTDNVDSLRKALEAHGVRVEKIEIVRMDDLQGTSGQQPGTGAHSDGSGHSQAEDRQETAQRTDALQIDNESAGLMDEPAGIYLSGVELRVDAIA